MRKGIAVVIVGAGIALATSPATAHTVATEARTTITFADPEPAIAPVTTDADDTFTGTVTADKRSCVADRVVRVFRRGIREAPDKSMGDGRTDRAGKWTIRHEDPGDGICHAVVTPRSPRRVGHVHFCAKTRSDSRRVDDEDRAIGAP